MVIKRLISELVLSVAVAASVMAQSSEPVFNTFFDEESRRTSIYLQMIPLPDNPKKFAVAAAFEFDGEVLTKSPCCVSIAFASIGKKDFDFKEDHDVVFWADSEKFEFRDTVWKESAHATAFVIARVAFPEEVWVGMKAGQFQKLAAAKSIKVRVGRFTFVMTEPQRQGLAAMAKRLNVAERPADQ